jgi:hypothetical protein
MGWTVNRRTLITHSTSLLAALLAVTASVFALDDHQSHIPVPPSGDINPVSLFNQRMLEAQQLAGLDKFIKQLPSNGIEEDRALKLLQNNPQLADLLRRMATDPSAAKRIEEMLQDFGRSGRLPPGWSVERIEQLLGNLQNFPSGGDMPPPPAAGDRPLAPQSPLSPPPPADPAERATRRHIAEHLAEMADRLPRELPENLRNSPAVQDFFHRMGQSAREALRNSNAGDGLDAQIARLEKQWKSFRDTLPKPVTNAFKKLRMPDFSRLSSNVRLPRLDFNRPSVPSMPSVPRIHGGSLGELSPAVNVILVAIGIAVLVAVFWRLRGSRSKRTSAVRPLGPWPLDPTGVASRDDLIRAFEYLSLLRCGERARTWHHREIAARLSVGERGSVSVPRTEAAEQLAGLYEQARYAPAAAAEPDWSVARGPLAILTGAG